MTGFRVELEGALEAKDLQCYGQGFTVFRTFCRMSFMGCCGMHFCMWNRLYALHEIWKFRSGKRGCDTLFIAVVSTACAPVNAMP